MTRKGTTWGYSTAVLLLCTERAVFFTFCLSLFILSLGKACVCLVSCVPSCVCVSLLLCFFFMIIGLGGWVGVRALVRVCVCMHVYMYVACTVCEKGIAIHKNYVIIVSVRARSGTHNVTRSTTAVS